MSARDERGARMAAVAAELGAAAVLLCGVDGVTYATGYAGAPELGPSPHAGGPNVALVTRAGEVALVVPDLEVDAAGAARSDRVRSYETFAARPHAAPMHDLLGDAVTALITELELRGATLAVDPSLPAPLGARLDALGIRRVDAHAALTRARATKTAGEITQMRRSAQIAWIGQDAAFRGARPGVSELALLGVIRTAMEDAAGATFALGVDLLGGVTGTANAMGGPGARVLEPGDPVLCDLGPRIDGYWGDSCTAFTLGPPSPGYARMHRAVREAVEQAAELIAPGVCVHDLDAAVRAPIERAGFRDPLHTGHGIGTANFEFPRIVPGERARLEPGMVLMVEPGAYDPTLGGVRLEWMFLVTESGNEILHPYPLHEAATI